MDTIKQIDKRIKQLKEAMRIGYEEGIYNPHHIRIIEELWDIKNKLSKDNKNKMIDINCWEFKNCKLATKCPAYPNDGKHCWYVMDTLCVDKKGCQVDKLSHCMECGFYKRYKK